MEENWLEIAKAYREAWKEATNSKDMPPYIIGEKGGQPVLMVVPPQVDKYLALRAAALVRTGFAIDALTVVTDGYTVTKHYGPDGYKRYEEIGKKYGTLQDAFHQGIEDVVECITAFHYYPDGTMTLGSAEYRDVDGKLVWSNTTEMNDKNDDGVKVSGLIAESIRKIMTSPSILEMGTIQQAAAKFGLEDDKNKQLYHAGRAVRRVLHEKNFLVMECVPWQKEEGCGVLFERMMQKFEEIKDLYDFDNMRSKIPQPSVN